jgi:Ca-activated chloride channel family protein
MTFHHPERLLLIALPVAWILWQFRRTELRLTLPTDHSAHQHSSSSHLLARFAECLPALLLTGAVLLLSGPRKTAPPNHHRILNNILFLVDVSGSMETPVPGAPTRFDAAMQAVSNFCNHRKGDAFGLSIFGIDHLHWFPPTKDLSAMKNALELLRPRNLPEWFAGTMIASGLEACVDRFESLPDGDRILILVTDGLSGDFNGTREREAAERLAQAKIRVFTVLIGTDAQPSMYEITSRTGGQVFRGDDPTALASVFQQIDKMQSARFKPVLDEWVDWYRPIALSSLASLALYTLSLLGLRFTPW